MKNYLLQENQNIIQEIFELKSEVPGKNLLLSQILSTFRSLEHKWLELVETSEKTQKSLKDRHSRTESSMIHFKQVQLKQQLRLTRCTSKELQLKNMHETVASHLKVFPKLWSQNLQKLKQKSTSWRFTPFASPTYDQEFDFLKNSRILKDSGQVNLTREFKKVKKNEKSSENFQEVQKKSPFQLKIIEDSKNTSKFSEKIADNTLQDDSAEFEKVMQEISENKANFSGFEEKSGWKSELESENDSQNISEIKNAISVLFKANLLLPEKRNMLDKITELVQNPEESEKLVLYLQLLSINQSLLQSYSKQSENDVKIEELLEATSFLSSLGPKKLESSLLELSFSLNTRQKRGSIGKCSTKEMT
jgi:hypothetical protein